jgi:hypothetical protein
MVGALVLALAVAVAGGNLALTTSTEHPRPGQRVVVRATGQVGDSCGRLYLYRNRGVRCGVSERDERRMGRRAARVRPVAAVDGAFDLRGSYRAGRAGTREWVCGYLYAITCDAAGADCGPAVGLPPDAGFFKVPIRVRRR